MGCAVAAACGRSSSDSGHPDGSAGASSAGRSAGGHGGASNTMGTGGNQLAGSANTTGGAGSAGEHGGETNGAAGTRSSGGRSAAGAGGGDTAGAGADGNETAGAGGESSSRALNLFVMFDSSWSMVQCGDGTPFTGGDPRCMTGPSRWDLASAAFMAFVQDPGTAGLGIALRFFPSDVPAVGCDGYITSGSGFGGMAGFAGTAGFAGLSGSGGAGGDPNNCNADACAVPLVDLGRLVADPAPGDTQESLLVAAVQMSGPPDVGELTQGPQTPTSAALAGAAQWAKGYDAAHPGETTAIILVTDGEPSGCDTNIANIAATANDAFEASGTRTYVVGLSGSSESQLNQIAVAGHTDGAFFVSDGVTVTEDLLAALNSIRDDVGH